MSDSDNLRKHALECMRLAADCMQLAGDAPSPAFFWISEGRVG